MYGWIWGRLPGNNLVRALLSLLMFAAVVAVLFTWVFPWAEPLLPSNDVTVNGGAPSATATAPAGNPSAGPSSGPSAPAAAPSAGGKASSPTLTGAALPIPLPLVPTGAAAS